MRARTRGKGGGPGGWSSWRRALLISSALHALALAAIGVGATGQSNVANVANVADFVDVASNRRGVLGFSVDALETPTLIDLAAAVDIMVPPVDPWPVDPAAMGVPADRTDVLPDPMAQAKDGAPDRRAPAPDRGAGAGRTVADRAWRRDSSTLHERLTDGADVNQPSHARTGAIAASPQAVRREPKTGTGDSSETSRDRPSPPAAQYGIEEPDSPGSGAETVAGIPRLPAPPPRAPAVDDPRPRPTNTTQGPLDSDRGTRSFDVEARRPTAADDQSTRAAANEAHPSIADLTVAAMSGSSREGRGPSDMPGAVAAQTRGAAPAVPGARGVAAKGADEEARTRERAYNRYIREIGARVNDALIWPRVLAVRLEQGQTVVRFVVLPDGTLGDGVRIVKSSGFAEFDQAALDAVRKASPFSSTRGSGRAGPVPVTMPVTFSNPVIR